MILKYSEEINIKIDSAKADKLPPEVFPEDKIKNINALSGQSFKYRWQLENALRALNPAWNKKAATVINKKDNERTEQQFQILEGTFKWVSQD